MQTQLAILTAPKGEGKPCHGDEGEWGKGGRGIWESARVSQEAEESVTQEQGFHGKTGKAGLVLPSLSKCGRLWGIVCP